jgi:hypothetical protein
VLEANEREEAEQQAAAAAARAAAAASRRGGGGGKGGRGGLYRYQPPGGGGSKGGQPGPQLTIRHHVSQLTGSSGEFKGGGSDKAHYEHQEGNRGRS